MRFELNENEKKYCQTAFLDEFTASREEAISRAIAMIGDIDTSKEFPSVWEKDGNYIVVRLKDREFPTFLGFKEVDDYPSIRKRIKNEL